MMAKIYRKRAVRQAVKEWARSEWFTAGELLDLAVIMNKQPRGGLTVFSVSSMLDSQWKLGKKQYRRIEEWE